MSESESAEHVREHIKLYWKIGVTLLVLTVVTVLASFLNVGVAVGIVIALAIAITKGSLVASYFMHLIGERKGIYAALALTAFFFVVLMLIPILGHNDTFGEHKTIPNANAPASAGDHGEAH